MAGKQETCAVGPISGSDRDRLTSDPVGIITDRLRDRVAEVGLDWVGTSPFFFPQLKADPRQLVSQASTWSQIGYIGAPTMFDRKATWETVIDALAPDVAAKGVKSAQITVRAPKQTKAGQHLGVVNIALPDVLGVTRSIKTGLHGSSEMIAALKTAGTPMSSVFNEIVTIPGILSFRLFPHSEIALTAMGIDAAANADTFGTLIPAMTIEQYIASLQR